MERISFVLLTLLLSIPLSAREYVFDKSPYLKKVIVKSRTYRVSSPDQINISKYKELSQFKTKKYTNKGRLTQVHIILSNSGELVRDTQVIKRVLFAKKYSQLDQKEIISIRSPFLKLITDINKREKDFSPIQTKHYFPSLDTIIYLTKKDLKLNREAVKKIDRQKLLQFIKLFLKNPGKGFKLTLSETLNKSKNLCQKAEAEIKNKSRNIISYEGANEIEELKPGLVYGKSTTEFLSDKSPEEFDELSLAEKEAKKILDKYNNELPIKNINKISSSSLLKFTKKLFHKVYGNEKVFIEWLDYIDDESEKNIRKLSDYEDQAKLSAEFFPYYKGDYSKYSVPDDVKDEYPGTLFYDDFSEGLARWKLVGPNKAKIIKDALSTNGNGWYYSGVSSKVMFNPHRGDIHIQSTVKLGQGKGSFGFGEKKLGDNGKQGVVPFIGFLFNQNIDGSGTVDFRINNELVETQFRIILDLTKEHAFKAILFKNNGVEFYIDGKKVFYHSFKGASFGSESVVLSSVTDDYFWKELVVHQTK